MDFPDLIRSRTPVRWWQITFVGLFIFIAGVGAFFWTQMFLNILITLFGILALVVGAVIIGYSLSTQQDPVYRIPIFSAGVLSLVVAATALLFPGVIQTTFIIIMAFIAIINSLLLILVGCTLSDEWKLRLVIILLGMLTLFLSILMALFPALSAIALTKVWGIYAWVIGILCVIAGLSLRTMKISECGTEVKPPSPS